MYAIEPRILEVKPSKTAVRGELVVGLIAGAAIPKGQRWASKTEYSNYCLITLQRDIMFINAILKSYLPSKHHRVK